MVLTGKRFMSERVRITKKYRKKMGNICMICERMEGFCDVHHIISLEEGGHLGEKNLIVLCPNCHRLAQRNIIPIEELKEIKRIIEVEVKNG